MTAPKQLQRNSPTICGLTWHVFNAAVNAIEFRSALRISILPARAFENLAKISHALHPGFAMASRMPGPARLGVALLQKKNGGASVSRRGPKEIDNLKSLNLASHSKYQKELSKKQQAPKNDKPAVRPTKSKTRRQDPQSNFKEPRHPRTYENCFKFKTIHNEHQDDMSCQLLAQGSES